MSAEPEKTLYKYHPAMFRNHPILFIISVILIAAFGVGLLILLIWWLSCYYTMLTVTTKRTTLRKGILSKYTNEVRHEDVRNVQTGQSLGQRIFGVGTIGISSAGQADMEIRVSGIPSPDRVKELIDAHRP